MSKSQIWYEAKEEITADGKTIKAAEHYCDLVAQKAGKEQKAKIIEIKEALIAGNLYFFDHYRSMDVYKAVMEMNIENIDDFMSEFNMEKDRD